MKQLLLAAFADVKHADRAIQDLEEAGYRDGDISVITQENMRQFTNKRDAIAGDATSDGAVTGAATGGALGGLAGLLAGAGVFPALAGLLIGGPIAVALGLTGMAAAAVSGVVTGALAGGLVGALTNLGVSEDVAAVYDETVTLGGVVVGVPTQTNSLDETRSILEAHGAREVTEVEVRELARHS